MRALDWSKTSLGPAESWPMSLKAAIRILLTSRYQMWMCWGADLIFFCNDAYRPTLGLKDRWALGSPAAQVWQEVWSAVIPRLDRVLGHGESTWDEGLLLFLERSGYPEETYHTFSYSPLADDAGAIRGMLCVVTEETERVITDRRLSTLRELASDLAGTSTEPAAFAAVGTRLGANGKDLPFTLTYLFDPDGRARLVCATGAVAGDPIAPAFVDPAAPDAAWPIEAVCARQGDVVVADLAGRFATVPAGAWDRPPREALLAPIARQGQDAPAGFLVAGINPYRPLDETYTGFIDLVAAQIGAAIANAQAYEAERRRAEALAEIDRAKTAFFSNVSHEFRTPLTLMMGPLEEALSDSPEALPQHRSELEVAHRNSLRLLKLVNSLLDFSRIEAGRLDARFRPTDLSAMTADLASSFRSALDRAGLALRIDAPPLPAPIHLDHDLWEKVILNLLSNAFKFTFEGEIAVLVRPSADGRLAEVEIRDTGIGIPPHELPRLFERFHRVEGARGRTFEGSGIGLALVQELVRQHGGDIRVTSEVGRGTSFVVHIPFGVAHLAREAVVEDSADRPDGQRVRAYVEEALRWLPDDHAARTVEGAGPAVAAAQPRGTAIPGQRILLADDNADMRDYVRRLLEAEGYDVDAAADGEAALAQAWIRPPDLILSDVMMPRLDGFGLARAIRADPALADRPIVMLSARAGEEARIEGLDQGVDDYLAKPFTARELLARIRANLETAGIRRQIAAALREEARTLETLNRVGAAVAAELDLERAVQIVTDAGTELTAAAFGAFFYNVVNERGEAYTLYTIAGAPREAFSKLPMPRNTAIFAPTFGGTGVVRSADIMLDPRYGKSGPYFGMPDGHLPVRSYLAVPVVSRSGEVLGGLFFGHPQPGIFTERAERLIVGIAAQAATAIDNGRLYQAARTEIERRIAVEAALRQSEEQLSRMNEALEVRVSERTAELLEANARLQAEAQERERIEEQLRQAQKMETIGQLAGGIAHDFNNLLMIITGNIETLLRRLARTGADPATLARSAENALRGAQRAASLTQSLLAFSRRQPLDPKSVDVNRSVASMSDLLRRTLGERISVETVLGGGVWRALVDPNQLENAILNLAVNARDAMPEGGRLTIETANAHLDEGYSARQAEVAPGQYVVICISDTGTGMTREVLARAFEPFFTTKDFGHGTGLGLSQVYGFVKQSGGHVKIYSEPGEGTSVKIYLPRLLADAEEAERAAPVESIPRGDRGETILVVEDDDDVRVHSVEILQELGYAVIAANTGDRALELLPQHPEIRLLFTDVGLPGGLNGRQLADRARALRPELPVLFTTGYARNAIVHDGRLDPGVQLITKPFTYSALAAKLRDVLDVLARPGAALLVEDETMIRMAAADQLEALGLRVFEAANATEALNAMRMASGEIDVAIVDLGLPDRAGDALARELRSMRADLPILIASGAAQSQRHQFRDDPLIGFLEKPYTEALLRAALAALGVRVAAADGSAAIRSD